MDTRAQLLNKPKMMSHARRSSLDPMLHDKTSYGLDQQLTAASYRNVMESTKTKSYRHARKHTMPSMTMASHESIPSGFDVKSRCDIEKRLSTKLSDHDVTMSPAPNKLKLPRDLNDGVRLSYDRDKNASSGLAQVLEEAFMKVGPPKTVHRNRP